MADPKVVESPDEILSTLSKDGTRNWIYATLSQGHWWVKRKIFGWLLIAFFVALPIIKIDGKPAVFLDVLHREFTFFGVTLYATETILLMLFGLASLFAVVAFTAILGRVWCGWACPQTVYLEFVFRPIERFFEGSAAKQRRRDEKKNDNYWGRKIGKWTAFTIASLAMAHIFVAYFASWDALLDYMTSSPFEHPGFFGIMGFTTALILFDFGIFREQMCTITCPYARIQSVLLDKDSLIVSYDPNRGEPRGKVGTVEGDCIDCGACVRTCPTGIDIRDGLQMECVNCTQCIDACDEIMIKIDRPTGLVRYTSENALAGKKRPILRPRLIIYAVALTLVFAGFAYVTTTRDIISVNIGRVPGMPYVSDNDRVLNNVRFRVQNRTKETMALEVVGEPDIEVSIVGPSPVTIEPEKTVRIQARIAAPKTSFKGGNRKATFQFVDQKSELKSEKTFNLVGPK